MKGTQGKEEESYPYFDIFPLEREIVKKYNQDDRFAYKAHIRLTEDGKYRENVNIYGELPPYRGMSWIELQARALSMASRIVTSNIKSK